MSAGKCAALGGTTDKSHGSWLLKALIASGESFSRPPIWRGGRRGARSRQQLCRERLDTPAVPAWQSECAEKSTTAGEALSTRACTPFGRLPWAIRRAWQPRQGCPSPPRKGPPAGCCGPATRERSRSLAAGPPAHVSRPRRGGKAAEGVVRSPSGAAKRPPRQRRARRGGGRAGGPAGGGGGRVI